MVEADITYDRHKPRLSPANKRNPCNTDRNARTAGTAKLYWIYQYKAHKLLVLVILSLTNKHSWSVIYVTLCVSCAFLKYASGLIRLT